MLSKLALGLGALAGARAQCSGAECNILAGRQLQRCDIRDCELSFDYEFSTVSQSADNQNGRVVCNVDVRGCGCPQDVFMTNATYYRVKDALMDTANPVSSFVTLDVPISPISTGDWRYAVTQTGESVGGILYTYGWVTSTNGLLADNGFSESPNNQFNYVLQGCPDDLRERDIRVTKRCIGWPPYEDDGYSGVIGLSTTRSGRERLSRGNRPGEYVLSLSGDWSSACPPSEDVWVSISACGGMIGSKLTGTEEPLGARNTVSDTTPRARSLPKPEVFTPGVCDITACKMDYVFSQPTMDPVASTEDGRFMHEVEITGCGCPQRVTETRGQYYTVNRQGRVEGTVDSYTSFFNTPMIEPVVEGNWKAQITQTGPLEVHYAWTIATNGVLRSFSEPQDNVYAFELANCPASAQIGRDIAVSAACVEFPHEPDSWWDGMAGYLETPTTDFSATVSALSGGRMEVRVSADFATQCKRIASHGYGYIAISGCDGMVGASVLGDRSAAKNRDHMQLVRDYAAGVARGEKSDYDPRMAPASGAGARGARTSRGQPSWSVTTTTTTQFSWRRRWWRD